MGQGRPNFECDVLDPAQVGSELEAAPCVGYSGTIVRWDNIRTFPASDDRRVTEDFCLGPFKRSGATSAWYCIVS